MKSTTLCLTVLMAIQGFTVRPALAEGSNGIIIRDGKTVLSHCDQKNSSALYIVMKDDKKIAEGKTNDWGCLSTTLPGLNNCDEVTLRFKNDKIDYQVPGQNCVKAPSEPSKPVQEVANLDKVKKTAETNARQFANHVASEFKQGKYNYIYNFIVGYINGLDLNIPFNQSFSQKMFVEGQLKGTALGLEQGRKTGEKAALTEALENSKNDVYSQITQGLDSNKELVLTPNAKVPDYKGASDSLRSMTLSEALTANSTRDMIIKKFAEAGYKLAEFQINAVMNRSINMREILSDLGPTWAYDNHLKNKENSQYVEELKKTSNASEATSAYEQQFKDTYWSVVDDKIKKKISQPQEHAQKAGLQSGLSLIALVAQSQGENDGYKRAYTPASKAGYQGMYPVVYSSNFGSHSNRLEKSMEISSVQATISDAQGGSQFVIGQPVRLDVDSVVNLGKVSGSIEVEVSGAIEAKSTLEVKGYSRNKGQIIENIGSISPKASLGTQKVEIKIADYTLKQNLEITWANQLKALATVTDPKALEDLANFITGAILQEWKDVLKDKTVTQNQILYRDAKAYPKSLLGQFEALAAKLKVKNPDLINEIVSKLQLVFFSMLSPASVENYAKTWLSKKLDPQVFIKTYSDAREAVAADPVLSHYAQGCVGADGRGGNCIGAINIKASDDYNKWSTGRMKVEAILKK